MYAAARMERGPRCSTEIGGFPLGAIVAVPALVANEGPHE
jgi:hypothetical protein